MRTLRPRGQEDLEEDEDSLNGHTRMSDSERAAALKAEGNALLKAKKYPEAVAKYTEVWQANTGGSWGVCECVQVCASVCKYASVCKRVQA